MFDIKDDLLDSEVVNNQHEYFNNLRAVDPVHWNKKWKGWVITRYDDICLLSMDPRVSANRLNPQIVAKMPKEGRLVGKVMLNWMVFMDPPEHTRVRKVLQKAFTPRSIKQMQSYTEQIVNEVLDRLEGQSEMDIVSDFAEHIPTSVLAKMMGLPSEDFDQIKAWTNDLNRLIHIDVNEPNRHKIALKGMRNMADYLQDVINERRKSPGDDLVSACIKSNENGILSDNELVAQCILLFQGGHESTTSSISSGLLTLLQHPSQLQKLRDNPALIDSAYEELLRFDGWIGGIRIAKEDFELRGKQISEGDRILIIFTAGNRDPEVFNNPEEMDITRNPNPHLTFGHGGHYCLGNQLARMEAKAAIKGMIMRFPNLKLQDYEWKATLIARFMKSLKVKF